MWKDNQQFSYGSSYLPILFFLLIALSVPLHTRLEQSYIRVHYFSEHLV